MTWPTPRRLISKNRRIAEDAQMPSHLTNSFSIAASTNVVTSRAGKYLAKPVDSSAPKKRRSEVGADDLPPHDAPKLAYLGLHLRGFAAQHLEDQTCIIREPAGAERQTADHIHFGLDLRINAIGISLGRAYEHIAKHVERIHHACLPHRIPLWVDQELFGK